MAVKIHEISCDTKADEEVLTLLGLMSQNFNYVEHIITFMVCEYLGLELPIAKRVVLNMREGDVINLCRTIIPAKETDTEVCEACMAFLENFDILSENRNIVTHSLAFSEDLNTVSLLRTTRAGKPDKIVVLKDELSEVCRELKELFHFGCTIEARHAGRAEGHKPVKLLPAPPKPNKLHLRQLVADNDQPQPQS